ncbi:MAG: mandelate racemase/muconate lactonizing enzyme family protein [Opitutales bacterium]|nr:mandelate racemase/muconate lactonizing enzyme family protein [Opitutales bacterium]
MKIDSLKIAHLGGPSTCLKIETDTGVYGLGEPSVETSVESVIKLVQLIGEEYLIGKDPFEIEKHRRTIQDALWYHADFTARAVLTGIENALLDLKARSLNIPLYELLGGAVRDEVRIYKWIGAADRSNLVEQATARVSEGIKAIKFSPTSNRPARFPQVIDEVEAIVSSVRNAIGPAVDIMLDPASRWKLSEAREILKVIEPYRILFAEDFIAELDVLSQEKLSAATSTPIALGDRLIGFKDFGPLIARQAVGVIQPDICHSGGLLELKAIARYAEQFGIRVAPHNPQGIIATATAIHFDLTVPNFLIQEIAGSDFFGAWSNKDLMRAPEYQISEGHIARPSLPGIGVEVSDVVFSEDFKAPPAPRFWDRDDFHVPEW